MPSECQMGKRKKNKDNLTNDANFKLRMAFKLKSVFQTRTVAFTCLFFKIQTVNVHLFS